MTRGTGRVASGAQAALAGLLLALSAAASAMDVDAPLPDPGQQALYERLTHEVRCLVCQNQTIADSTAPLAGDLRREIRSLVAAGQDEAAIKEFLLARYGDFVLYRPRFGGRTLALWGAPGLLLLLGGFALARTLRRRAALPVEADPDSVDPAP